MGGDANQWQPNLFRNTTQIYPFQGKPEWNLVTGMADDAIDYLNRIDQTAPSKPFFVKYAPGATHAPHHPTKEWVEKIRAMHLFDDGWNKLRERIFENQKRLGVIPADTKLEPWPTKVIKNWDDCTPEEKKLYIRQVEIFAAYAAYNDHEIGRVIQAIEDMGKLDDTLIIYISGDNGTSAEGGPLGTPNEVAFFNGVAVPVDIQMKWYDVWGTEQTYNHMSAGWSWAFDTPFTWFKQNAFEARRHPAEHRPSPGRRALRTRAPSASSSATSSMLCPPSSRSPAFPPPNTWTASSRRRSRARASPTRLTRRTPRHRRSTKAQYLEMMGQSALCSRGMDVEHAR